MTRTHSRTTGLIALNAVLLGALAVLTLAPGAHGQQGQRARGDYTMIHGRIQGSVEDAIYIVDASNLELVGVRWDNSRRSLSPIGYRSLATDFTRTDAQGR